MILEPYLRNKVLTADVSPPGLGERLAARLTRRRFERARLLLSERVLEYPLLFQALDPKARTVLEFGCCDGLLSMHLASMGYDVTGLDFQDYPLKHPNFKFTHADILAWSPPKETFDAVVSISTVEHVGLGGYGDPISDEGDVIAVRKLYECVRLGGTMHISVPAGRKTTRRNMRIYDEPALIELLPPGARIRWFAKDNRYGHWVETTGSEMSDLVYDDYESTSPAMGLGFATVNKGQPEPDASR